MPIYEYRCAACGFQKEYLQRLSDVPLTECPECGKRDFNKMVTAAGFQLKGSGWYVTDFKNGSKPAKVADKSADKSVDKVVDSGVTKKDEPKESKPEPAGGEPAGGTGTSPASS